MVAEPNKLRMIVGLHDLAEPADARGDELLSWMPFTEVSVLLDRLAQNTRRNGIALEITSDDAFRSDYELLVPWLLERRLAATFFVPTRFVGQPGRLTVARLREMAGLGMTIGVHGARHIDWARAGHDAFVEDLREGREALQQMLGAPVDRVAPPFGGYDGPIVARLTAEGFREIHTCRPGLALAGEALKPRNMIKRGAVEAVLAMSHRRGGPRDALRCRLRRLRAGLHFLGVRA